MSVFIPSRCRVRLVSGVCISPRNITFPSVVGCISVDESFHETLFMKILTIIKHLKVWEYVALKVLIFHDHINKLLSIFNT